MANILAAQLRPITESIGQLTTSVTSNTDQISRNTVAISAQGDIVSTNVDSIQALQDSVSSATKTGTDLVARVSNYEENQSRRDRQDLTR